MAILERPSALRRVVVFVGAVLISPVILFLSLWMLIIAARAAPLVFPVGMMLLVLMGVGLWLRSLKR